MQTSSRGNFGQPFRSETQPILSGGPPDVLSQVRRGQPSLHDHLQLRILVIDDVADVTDMISLFLKHAGFAVTTADSASMALELAAQEDFNLVISDIGMPRMNGYQLATELRNLPGYATVPMIAVTGYSEYNDRGRALGAGFNTHLTKPIDPDGLLNLIKELLG